MVKLRKTNSGDTTWKFAFFKPIVVLGDGSNIASPRYNTMARIVDTYDHVFKIIIPAGDLYPNTEVIVTVIDKSKEASAPTGLEMINDMVSVTFKPSNAGISLDRFNLTWLIELPVLASRRYKHPPISVWIQCIRDCTETDIQYGYTDCYKPQPAKEIYIPNSTPLLLWYGCRCTLILPHFLCLKPDDWMMVVQHGNL
jgi:hypothetical protein